MRARRTGRRWWWVSAAAFAVALAAIGLFLSGGPPRWLTVADQLSSVGGLLVAVAALVVSAVGVWAALRSGLPQESRPTTYDPPGQAADDRRLWNVAPAVHTFVGRDELLRRIGDISGKIVLYGQPGVGKTQLALTWAHQRVDACEIGWWVRAGDAVTMTADLADLAAALGVGDEDAGRAAANAVSELSRRTRWLLVFDDAVNASSILPWLPHRGGHVLITSRSPSWDSVGTAVEVPPFGKEVAAKFLRDRAHDPNPTVASQLAALLGGLPLALEQAGAYCQQTGRSLASYLAMYQAAGGKRLLEHGAPDAYAPGPVTVTVRLAVRLVARRDLAAAQLLYLLAFLAPTAIPRDLASAAPRVLPRPLRQVAADPVRLDQAVRVLIENALAAPDQPGHLRMHQLVQDILRQPHRKVRWWQRAAHALRLPGTDPLYAWNGQRWAKAATRLLTAALPTHPTNSVQWERLTALTPHAHALILQADGRSTDTARLQTSLSSLALKMRDVGELDAALQLAEQIVQVRSRLLGQEHPDTLASMNDLAATLSAGGNLPAARQLVEHILQVRRRTLGEEHPDTLATMNDLATILRNDGRLRGAQQLVEQTLKARRRALGDEHPDTVASMNQLSDVLENMRDVDTVYASVARRSWMLVERLLLALDKAERHEEDPDRLQQLFHFDHLATRLRRNQEMLLFLAGASDPLRHRPAPLVDVMRAAVAEIEQYTRVELRLIDRDTEIPSHMVNDLINLVAELLENATMFSPPSTTVVLDAKRVSYSQATVSIWDRGIGLLPHQLDAMNEQLANPAPLHDIRERLGIPVIARLAAKHGIHVRLHPNEDGGTLALATVPLPRAASPARGNYHHRTADSAIR